MGWKLRCRLSPKTPGDQKKQKNEKTYVFFVWFYGECGDGWGVRLYLVVTLFSDGGDLDCDCSDCSAAISVGLHQIIMEI